MLPNIDSYFFSTFTNFFFVFSHDFLFMIVLIAGHMFSFWFLEYSLVLSAIVQGVFAAHFGFLQHNNGHRTTFGTNRANFVIFF